jgi:adenylate cyclase
VVSRWVRGEARDAAERGILVPARFDQARLPIDVRAIHTTDLDGWKEDPASVQAQEFMRALDAMIARATTAQAAKAVDAVAPAAVPEKPKPKFSICVLPFVNMSGDPEQEYFSDGITEDILTDLSKISALSIISRNGSFLYKGKQVDIPQMARDLNVTHVLEGSVRKAGGRVRISAQLIDGTANNHVWAERYDRDASDIFELQDEISHAIVKALKLRLLPEEKKAIERRGTESVEAHDLYLMARQIYVTNQLGESASKAIVRACMRATEIDPNYAQAWALMATGYRNLRELDVGVDDGMAAAERALALDPDLAEAHAVKAYILQMKGSMDEAIAEVETALRLDPESYEANRAAGRLNYQLNRLVDAIRFFEKALSLMDSDVNTAILLISTSRAAGDKVGMRRAAELASRRADAVLALDRNNANVMAYSALALGALGEAERAKARMNRALLIDPDNLDMRYNFACALNGYMDDKCAALEMLEPLLVRISAYLLRYLKADPDLESLRDDPHYQAMVAAAEARLAVAKPAASPKSEEPA